MMTMPLLGETTSSTRGKETETETEETSGSIHIPIHSLWRPRCTAETMKWWGAAAAPWECPELGLSSSKEGDQYSGEAVRLNLSQ